jgi:hypothetical protein
MMQRVRSSALARPVLICVDGLARYITSLRVVFRSEVLGRGRGRPHLAPWLDIHVGQLVKQYLGHRAVGLVRRMVQGTESVAQRLLAQGQSGGLLNTAYIDLLNDTFRSWLTSLERRCRALLKNPETFTQLVYLMGSVYNFSTED